MARNIKKLILHCTDSDDSLDIGFEEVNRWHKERGWLGKSGISCGYHFIVRRDGTIEIGRPLWDTGAHCKGQNRDSVGISWVGRNNLTDVQETKLLWLCRALCGQYGLKGSHDVFGHNAFSTKTCPNIDMVKFVGNLLFMPIALVPQDIKDMVKP